MERYVDKKHYRGVVIFVVLILLSLCKPITTYAESSIEWDVYEDESFVIKWQVYEEEWIGDLNWGYYTYPTGLSYNVKSNENKEIAITVTSTNKDVLEIKGGKKEHFVTDGYDYGYVEYSVNNYGVAAIQFEVDGYTKKQYYSYLPNKINIKSIKQTGYNTFKLTWDKVSGMDGYVIERAYINENGVCGEYKTLKTIKKNTGAATLTTDSVKMCRYRVKPYVIVNKKKVYGGTNGTTADLQMVREASQITSIKQSGSNKLQISWKKMKGASGYKVYRSETEMDGYKCVYTAKSGDKTTWKQKVTKGKTYYYYVVTIYPNGKSEASKSVAQIIPKKTKSKVQELTGIELGYIRGQYGGSNYANSDRVYYYEASGNLHIVSAGENCVIDYTLNSKGVVASKKTIKINYDVWGGFYKGTDGKFYVVVGYSNAEEKKDKTVIKVIQYTNKWKKQKTASIKGGAANAFEGIESPLYAGNCSMAMNGDELYLFTARRMFIHSDGLRHQSNISFRINTKTMKAEEANESYVSHSFNQYVKYKDGDLYLLDHGDAYPRSLVLTAVTDEGKYESNFFSFQGQIGANYTGCTVGGMEVGNKNILTCGASVPHDNKIKGITGSGNGYKKNVYVAVTDREKGTTKIKWLTSYHPLNTTVTVGDTRMLKLAENRYAILYSATKNNVETVHYVVVDNNGKKIYSTSYSGMKFSGGTQPIIYNGSIIWVERYYSGVTWYGLKTELYQIPVITEKP